MQALTRLNDTRAVPPLVAALTHAVPYVRATAAEALGQIGDARAVAPLKAALQDTDIDVRDEAAQALSQITARHR
jgi:HEAT repeat protein